MTNIYREARNARPMTQEELAIAADVSVRTIRRLENGETVGAESRRAVSAVLGIFEPVGAASAWAGSDVAGKLEIQGQGMFMNTFDSEGVIVSDLPALLGMAISLMVMVLGYVGVLRRRAEEAGALLEGESMLPDWLMVHNGVPAIGLAFLSLIFFTVMHEMRRGRVSQVEMVLERNGTVSIPDAVAHVLGNCRTGSHTLSLNSVEATMGELKLVVLTRKPETLGEIVSGLRGLGIVSTRKVYKKGLLGERNAFAPNYI